MKGAHCHRNKEHIKNGSLVLGHNSHMHSKDLAKDLAHLQGKWSFSCRFLADLGRVKLGSHFILPHAAVLPRLLQDLARPCKTVLPGKTHVTSASAHV